MIERLRFLTADLGSGAEPGVLFEDRVHGIGALLATDGHDAPATMVGLIERWPDLAARVADALGRGSDGGRPLHEVKLLTPLRYPGAFYAAGANYSDHLLEMTGKPAPPAEGRDPYFFLKAPRATLIGPGDPIPLPRSSQQLDWELEVAMVVGREARHVSEADAMDHVFGFTIVNDVSARDLFDRGEAGHPAFRWDWLGHKSPAGAAPCGPWITPRAAVPDPGKLSLRLWVDDRLEQDSNTSRLVHGYAAMVSFLSRATVLYPGDLIATGTPAGVGLPKGRFLRPGQRVRIEVEGLGVLENPVVAA